MIQNLIKEVSKYIPSYPPLQSFNSCNPLAGLNELSFNDAIALVSKYAPISGTLPLHKYHLFWRSGKININNLRVAIKDFINKQNIRSINEDILLPLFLNKSLQSSLEAIDIKSRRNASSQVVGWFVESNQRVFQFVGRFFDIGQARWQMPVCSNQLFSAWLEYASVNYKNHFIIANLNEDVYQAIEFLLKEGGLEPIEYEEYLLKVLFQIIGWASFVHWLESAIINPHVDKHGKVADIVAIWLAETIVLTGKLQSLPDQTVIQLDREFGHLIQHNLSGYNIEKNELQKLNHYNWGLIWQFALEHNYRDDLIRQINLNKHHTAIRPKAQAIFCVDVRSEGLRRHLESYGNYQTFGTAGFFGLGFDFHFHHHVTRQNPDWSLSHSYLRSKNKRLNPINKILINLINGLLRTKKSFLGPLVLFDVVGLWYSLRIMTNTLIPWKKKIISKPELNYDSFNIFQDSNLTTIELSQKIARMLRNIGLVDNFSDLVLICGHLSESVNNPFISSLHCGACGGNSGAPNAIAFCQAINDALVRDYLRSKEDIDIPKTTQFVAATHNTTTDEINYYYNQNDLAMDNLTHLDELKRDLAFAGTDLCEERRQDMDGQQSVNVRKADWAELQPELGQVNNAALVIGDRSITKNLNLHRRVFLQSYDYTIDKDGSILNDIFNSTVKVVSMINSQYYFSTTDQDFYGSGNKVLHNIVSQIGVMEGNSSDLKIGLTQQSLFLKGEPIHLPLRLCIVVNAPSDLVDKVLAKNEVLTNLIKGDWVSFHTV